MLVRTAETLEQGPHAVICPVLNLNNPNSHLKEAGCHGLRAADDTGFGSVGTDGSVPVCFPLRSGIESRGAAVLRGSVIEPRGLLTLIFDDICTAIGDIEY